MTVVESRPAGSYDATRVTTGGRAAEYRRLEAQAELSFTDELPILRGAGLQGPLLELGAGTGAITRRLRAAFPGLRIIAMDVDPTILALGGAADVTMVGDAHALPLPDASVGSVLMRYVVQHLARPVDALREVRRVLRPDGVVVVTDVDDGLWGLADPTYPDVARVHARLAASQRDAGGDRGVGRRLTRLLRAAGFAEPRLRTFTTTNDDRPIAAFEPHLGPGRLAPLLAAGELSMDDFALAVRRWNQFRNDPNAWIMLLGFSAVAHKRPPTPVRRRERMTTEQERAMNPNLKIFVAVFLFIAGAVGIVLAVLNASEKPASTTAAIIYGVLGVAFLIGGFLLVRKRRY